MGMFELAHPLGKDVETIHTAVSMGFVYAVKEQNPNIKLNYEDPIASGVGVATLRVADWDNDNLTAIYFPFAVDPADTTWQVFCEDGLVPVRQRIFTRDSLGRGFPVTLAGEKIISPYVQFDVLDEGLVMSVDDNGEQKLAYAGYESAPYDSMERIARHQSSVRALLELANAA